MSASNPASFSLFSHPFRSETYDYLFALALKMHQLGLDPAAMPL